MLFVKWNWDLELGIIYVNYGVGKIWWTITFGLFVRTNSSPEWYHLNSLRPRQNGRRFADDTFKHIFLNENVRISIRISLKFVPKGPINNIPAMVQIMAWRRPGDKPLFEPMVVSLATHICVARPQWVNSIDVMYPMHYMVQLSLKICVSLLDSTCLCSVQLPLAVLKFISVSASQWSHLAELCVSMFRLLHDLLRSH